MVAYVDRDWLRIGCDVPALEIDASSARFRSGEQPHDGAQHRDRLAARAIISVARAAAAMATEASSEGRIAVTGGGALAWCVRQLTGAAPGSSPADVIVETTGVGSEILEASRRLSDLGTLVMAGESSTPLPFDLYPDVHVRGLTIVGAPQLLAEPIPSGHDPLEAALLDRLVRARPGAAAPGDALWLRVAPTGRASECPPSTTFG